MFHLNGESHFSDPVNRYRNRVPIAPVVLVSAVFVAASLYVWPLVASTPQTPPKSKIEQELEKKGSSTKTPAPTPSTNSGHTRSESRRRTPPEFQVTFICDVPGTEIALDGNVIGKIKEDKRLIVKVRQGRYIARASMKGYNPQSMPVVVFGQTLYTVLLGKPLPPPTPTGGGT